mgnify:CR=1 FL=1|tara:strand:- start:1036 stop:1689 length:654 start_codon:yes stop_codon:yes gene_type:complete
MHVGKIVAKLLLAPIRVAAWLGLVRVTISAEVHSLMREGKVLVVSNHPSLIETFVLRVVLEQVTSKPIWSVADERLFPSMCFESFQCIPVHRGVSLKARKVNVAAARQQDALLEESAVVVLYPEGTRTAKALSHQHAADGRRIGQCHTTLARRALDRGAAVVPVWVAHGRSDRPHGYCIGYLKLLFGQAMVVKFGHCFEAEASESALAVAILAAGNS